MSSRTRHMFEVMRFYNLYVWLWVNVTGLTIWSSVLQTWETMPSAISVPNITVTPAAENSNYQVSEFHDYSADLSVCRHRRWKCFVWSDLKRNDYTPDKLALQHDSSEGPSHSTPTGGATKEQRPSMRLMLWAAHAVLRNTVQVCVFIRRYVENVLPLNKWTDADAV